jgi:hypothetical protein
MAQKREGQGCPAAARTFEHVPGCVGESSRGIWPPRPEGLIWDEGDPGAKVGGNLWISGLIPEVGERAAHYADPKR